MQELVWPIARAEMQVEVAHPPYPWPRVALSPEQLAASALASLVQMQATERVMVLAWKVRADEGGGNRAKQIGTAMYWSKCCTPNRSSVSSCPQTPVCSQSGP